jgi:hypothetical protein
MEPYLPHLVAESHVLDLRRAAARRGRTARADAGSVPDVLIRMSTAADRRALGALAVLDDAAPPAGPALLAEVGGAAVAAIPLDGGRAIADPFRRTADIVALLQLRAAQLNGGTRPRRIRRLVASSL